MTPNPEWEISPATLKHSLDAHEDFLLLDVRQPREHAAAAIEGARLIPLNQLPAALESELAPYKDKKIITLCHHGVRSLNAAHFLRHHGFTNVLSLAGGIDAYSQLADPSIPRY